MTSQSAPDPQPTQARSRQPDLHLVLLVGLAAGILLLAAFGLYLAQDPQSPLPWQPPTQTFTITPTATLPLTPVPPPTAPRPPPDPPRSFTAPPTRLAGATTATPISSAYM